MNEMPRSLAALLAGAALVALSACAPAPVVQARSGSDAGAVTRPRAPSPAPARVSQRPSEFIAMTAPSWFGYADRAGADPTVREEASERDFQYLKGTGLERIVLPRTLSADHFPVQVDDILGETALQLECEGAGCAGLMVSIRSPSGRGSVVRLDTSRAYPLLWIKNPTMYPQNLELNIDPRSTLGRPLRLKLSQWRFYLWAR